MSTSRVSTNFKSLDCARSLAGEALTWTERNLPTCIPADSGMHFIDQNSSKNPKHPFEVVFKAIGLMKPEYRFDSIDTLVNRNSLRRLLDFCAGREQSSFRMDLYTINNTLIIERCEMKTKEFLCGSNRSGYGHNFVRFFTEQIPGLADSTAHHRVLKYEFGGLNIAVRFEVDASYRKSKDASLQTDIAADDKRRNSASDLVSQLHALQISASGASARTANSRSVVVVERGKGSLQSDLVELKTNRKSRNQIMPQLWFGRTPYLIRGHHTAGRFEKVEVSRAGDDFKAWETNESNQRSLRKVVSLVSQIRDIVTKVEGNAAVMIFQKEQPERLEIFARNAKKSPLPFDIVRTFWT